MRTKQSVYLPITKPQCMSTCELHICAVALQIQYFSRAFQPLKNSFVETLRAVILSVRWFLVLLLLTLWGFAGALMLVPQCAVWSRLPQPPDAQRML